MTESFLDQFPVADGSRSQVLPAVYPGSIVEIKAKRGTPYRVISVGRGKDLKTIFEDEQGQQYTIALRGLVESNLDFTGKIRPRLHPGQVVRWVSAKPPKGVDRDARYVITKGNDAKHVVNLVRLGGEDDPLRYYRALVDSVEVVDV